MKKRKLTFLMFAVFLLDIFLLLILHNLNSVKAEPAVKPKEITTFEPSDYSSGLTNTPPPSPTPVIYNPTTGEVKTYEVFDDNYSYGYSVSVPSDWKQSTFAGESDGTNFNMNYYYENPYCDLRIYVNHVANPKDFNYDMPDWDTKTFTNQNGIILKRTMKGTSYAWTMPSNPYFWIAKDIDCDNSEEIYNDFLESFNIIDK